LAAQIRRQGSLPFVVLLTDGRANVTLDGEANRKTAAEDAQAAARRLRALEVPWVLLYTSRRR
ncbi:MAG: magnesium chelatase ATPase subunit D, partial [Pseudomonadota bacterium]